MKKNGVLGSVTGSKKKNVVLTPVEDVPHKMPSTQLVAVRMHCHPLGKSLLMLWAGCSLKEVREAFVDHGDSKGRFQVNWKKWMEKPASCSYPGWACCGTVIVFDDLPSKLPLEIVVVENHPQHAAILAGQLDVRVPQSDYDNHRAFFSGTAEDGNEVRARQLYVADSVLRVMGIVQPALPVSSAA